MRKAALTLLFLAGGAYAQDAPVAKLSGPATAAVGEAILLNSGGSVGKVKFGVARGPVKLPIVTLKSDDGSMVVGLATAPVAGNYVFFVVSIGITPAGADVPLMDFAFHDVRVGGAPPPDPPKPPDPPVPPPPGPDDKPPIPAEGLHVLIVYDDAQMASLPQSQADVLKSTEIREYLRAKGNNYRVWKTTTNPAGAPQVWQDAFARPRKSTPWIVVSRPGKGGYEGPLPATIADTMTLLKKYGD